MAGGASFWTPERDATARRLRAEGVSAREIARLIGAPSRSAVLGRLWRLESETPRERAPRRVLRWRSPPMVPAPPPPQTPVACVPRPWLSRGAGECAFPVAGEGVAVLSCCNPVAGRLYCAGHRSAMFPSARRPRRAETINIAVSNDTEKSAAMTEIQPKRAWR